MIFLSLGSNLSSKFGDRFDNLLETISHIQKIGIIINKKSSFYETPSYPNKNNPKFINIMISVNSSFSPIELISNLIDIEKKLGRKRVKKNEPRICDIDIIDYKKKIINTKHKKRKLIIPHKKLESRNLVLLPLQEIEPNWQHPKTKEFITSIIGKLSKEDRKSILKIKKH